MSTRAEPIAIRAAAPAISDDAIGGPSPNSADAALLYGLVALLVFGFVAFGAVEPWSVFTIEAGALFLFSVWAIKHLAAERFSIAWNPLYPGFALLAVAVAIQLGLGLTVYGYATQQQAMKYVAYLFLVVVANECFHNRALINRFGLLLSLFGFVLAAVALAQDVTHSSKLLFVRIPQETGWSYGPYLNHNHYAGLMEMLAPFPLTLAMAPYLRGRIRALLGAAAAIMVATIFLCASRGGVIAFFAQAAFLALVFARGRQRRRKIAITAVFAFILLAALFAFGKGTAFDRLASLRDPVLKSEIPGLRLAVLRDSHAMFLERPALGWGLGTFEHVYPQFRSFYTNDHIGHAHNDYLELLLETGLIGFAGVLWFVLLLLHSGWKKVPQWKTDLTGTVKIAATAGCIGILVHSFLDFNLQITANAALFYVLSTMVVGSLEENTLPSVARSAGSLE